MEADKTDKKILSISSIYENKKLEDVRKKSAILCLFAYVNIKEMELIRESMRAVTGTEGSGSDNSYSLETPQLDWYPGNQARQRPSLIYKTQSCRGDGKMQRAIREYIRGN